MVLYLFEMVKLLIFVLEIKFKKKIIDLLSTVFVVV